MKYFYGAFLLIAFTATSCKNDEIAKNQADPRLLVPFTQQTAVQNNNGAVPTSVSGNHNLFHDSNSATTATVLAGVNPAHGQPNHRCDIAVGEPLNATTTAAATNNVSVQTPPVVNTTASSNATAKGINPPHGEKNHRCDIAVGAPLNATPSTTTSVSVPQESTPPNTPIVKSNVIAGVNPAHGLEGHRCDIAVGAALPHS
jgi:hypothetical protein